MMARVIGIRAVLMAPLVVVIACAQETPTPVVSEELLSLDADDLVIGMEHEMTQAGVRSARLFSDTAFYFNDSTAVHLRGLRLTVFTDTGRERATVTAQRGRLDEDSQKMVAYGDVVLVIPTGNRRLESSELHYDPELDRIWSDSATVFTDGGTVTEGTGFESDLSFNDVRVRGGRTRGGGVIRF